MGDYYGMGPIQDWFKAASGYLKRGLSSSSCFTFKVTEVSSELLWETNEPNDMIGPGTALPSGHLFHENSHPRGLHLGIKGTNSTN